MKPYIEHRGTDAAVMFNGTSLFRGTEDQAEAYLAGFLLGFDHGHDDGKDEAFETYACFDEEGNGPIMSRRALQKICEGNAAALAARSGDNSGAVDA